MKTKLYILRVAIVLVPLLLNACASTAAPAAPVAPAQVSDPAGAKVQAVKVAYTGVVESMEGSQWVVNSQSITVDPAVVQGGPFKVGDTIKLEGRVQADGSIQVTRIEMPSAEDLSDSVDTPSDPAMDVPAELIFDDDGTEAWGTVEAITADSITISGQTFPFAPGAEINGMVIVGSFVKIEFLVNADGTLAVREVKLSSPSEIPGGEDDNNGNENDDNGNENDNDGNENDDNGNENDNDGNENENDDNGNENDNDGNSNDDNGNDDNGNSNDDNSNDDNGNDDNGNDDNGNDDTGNDDNSNDDNGGDDGIDSNDD